MDEPQRQRDGQGGRRVPLDPAQPSESADRGGPGGGDERQEQREPDESRPGQELERNTVRLGHRRRVLAVALARDLEGVGACSLEWIGSAKMSNASRHQASRLFELALRNRVGSFDTSPPRNSSATRPAFDDQCDSAGKRRKQSRDPPERGLPCDAPHGSEWASRELEATSATSAAPATRITPNQRSVGDTVRARLAILDESGPGERPRGDDGGGDRQRPRASSAPSTRSRRSQSHRRDAEHRRGDTGP